MVGRKNEVMEKEILQSVCDAAQSASHTDWIPLIEDLRYLIPVEVAGQWYGQFIESDGYDDAFDWICGPYPTRDACVIGARQLTIEEYGRVDGVTNISS
jgi:hypothetical protein